jgi:hypothetical protein
MDEQATTTTVQHRPQPEEGWPKKRTLLINARPGVDFIRAYQLLRQLPEDFAEHKNGQFGRHHGIAYGRKDEPTIYAWRTKSQVTLYFDHSGVKE